MIKQTALFWAKAGLPPEAFKRAYEDGHAPLVVKHAGEFFSDYRRSFPLSAPSPAPWDEYFDFQVITQVWFESEEVLARMAGLWANPAVGQIIADDEERFLDRTRMQVYMVDERVDFTSSKPLPINRQESPFKFVFYSRGAETLSYENFRDRFEAEVVPPLMEEIDGLVAWRRNYTIPGSTFVYEHIKEQMPPPPSFTVMSEMWFDSQDAAAGFASQLARQQTPLGRAHALFQDDAHPGYQVDEHVSEVSGAKAGS